MPRPAPSLASVAADLARHAAGERPAWITPATWRRLRALAAALRAGAVALVEREGVTRAAEQFAAHPDTVRVWRATGWLREPQEAPQGAERDRMEAAS